MAHLTQLLETYGLAAVLLGAFLEGETVVLLGGFLAHRGYLPLEGAMAAAWIGALAGDQLYFALGRRSHGWLLARRPLWAARVDRLRDRLERNQLAVMFAFRFVYGIRTATPFAIGMSRIPALRFLTIDTLSAAVWAALVTGAGYGLGEVILGWIQRVERYEGLVVASILGAAVLVWSVRFLRTRS